MSDVSTSWTVRQGGSMQEMQLRCVQEEGEDEGEEEGEEEGEGDTLAILDIHSLIPPTHSLHIYPNDP